MKQFIFFVTYLLVNFAHAEPSTYRGHCLNAIADMEFGEKRDAKFQIKAQTTDGASYVWSGNEIRSAESGFFKRSSRVVWSLEEFQKTGDGRVSASSKKDDVMSPQELKAMQSAFIRLGYSRLNYTRDNAKQERLLEKVYAACESVDDVQTKEGVTISKVSQDRRAQVHKDVPDLFGPVKSRQKSGQR